MKKGIVISAIVGLASGAILGIMATSKRGIIWRKKFIKDMGNNAVQLEQKIMDIMYNKSDVLGKDELTGKTDKVNNNPE